MNDDPMKFAALGSVKFEDVVVAIFAPTDVKPGVKLADVTIQS